MRMLPKYFFVKHVVIGPDSRYLNIENSWDITHSLY